MNKKNIPIFFSCDDKYVPFLAIALESMQENASRDREYEIKILYTNNISDENKKYILGEYNVGVFHIEFVDITDCVEYIANKLHTRDYYSKSTYYRLFIPNLYKEYDKVLYLDSDIVVKGDISELYDTEIGNNFVGAATDEFVFKCKDLHDYATNRVTVKRVQDYFNAGILLMNCKKLREVDFESKFIKLISEVTFDVAQDQDYLNAICKGKVKYISGLWDKMPFEDKNVKPADVKLFHFNLDLKPWQKDNVPYEEEFWHYAKASKYYNTILDIKKGWTAEKIEIAKKQTISLVENANKQANDVVENARIRSIIDSVFTDDDTSLLAKQDVVTNPLEEEFDLLNLLKKKEKIS